MRKCFKFGGKNGVKGEVLVEDWGKKIRVRHRGAEYAEKTKSSR